MADSKTMGGKNGVYKGQMGGEISAPFADPHYMGAPPPITGLDGTFNDIPEKSGFVTNGYLYKGDTPYGENAKMNFLPPGMEIDNQEMARIYPMQLIKLTEESYPGDGWMPKPGNVVG